LNTPSKDAGEKFPLHQPNAANLVEFLKEIFRGRRLRWIQKHPGIKLSLLDKETLSQR